jgi:antirestriction protein ArdC
MKIEQAKQLTEQALDKLIHALETGKSEALRAYLAAVSRFHRYSWGNVMLIMFQRPSATYAAGFNTWKSLGRHVKKGEKGITVLAPIVVSRKKEQAEVEDQREEQQAVAGFRPVTVFDILQTQGQPLPEVTKIAGEPKSYTDRLKDYVERLGIELEYSSEIQPAKGVSCGGKIILLPDLNPGEAFATLVHEAAHEALHKADRRAQTTRSIRESEAEAVAFVVSHVTGLDCLSASADYIQLWNGDRTTLIESLQFIQRTASQILSAISPDELSLA